MMMDCIEGMIQVNIVTKHVQQILNQVIFSFIMVLFIHLCSNNAILLVDNGTKSVEDNHLTLPSEFNKKYSIRWILGTGSTSKGTYNFLL